MSEEPSLFGLGLRSDESLERRQDRQDAEGETPAVRQLTERHAVVSDVKHKDH